MTKTFSGRSEQPSDTFQDASASIKRRCVIRRIERRNPESNELEYRTSCSERNNLYRDKLRVSYSERYQHNESDSSEDIVYSFDGLNNRVVNRYAIGLDMLKAQIHHGADHKSLRTHGDRTSLMFSVLAEDFSFVKTLVNLGVDVNQTNSK